MNETGDKLNAAYRALPREEPSAALDSAILAASRHALAKPSASRRWATPVSIAAVLVLAFGVTLHMQTEKPGVESPEFYSSPPAGARVATPPTEPDVAKDLAKQEASQSQPLRDARPQPEKKIAKVVAPEAKPDFVPPPPKAKLQEAPAPVQAAPARPQAFEEDKARQRRDEGRAENEQKQKDLLQKESNANISGIRGLDAAGPKPAAPPAPAVTGSVASVAPPPAAAAAPASRAAPALAAPSAEMRLKREAVAADAQVTVDEPTRELEAIAKLRVEGRQEEADKALAEFRRKRPDYRIPDPMWERVKPR